MGNGVAVRLSVMFFLQFFVWGGWYVTVGNYMASVGLADIIHLAYSVGPFAALVAPFFLGLVADRFFPTQQVLGVLNLVGGLALFAAAQVGGSSGPLFIGCLLLHMLCFFPTLGLTATLTFHHIVNREREFPLIRVFGSIGWIAAGVLVSGILRADESVLPLVISAGVSLILGVYCFWLPHTPPARRDTPVSLKMLLGWDAFQLFRNRAFLVLILCELLISLPLATYYTYGPVFVNAAGLAQPAFKMSFGQMSEVVLMFAMPFFFSRLTLKNMFLIGFGAWVLRFVLLAVAAPEGIVWMIIGGIMLHGFCFNFVYVSGQIFLDRQASPEIRGQAQGMLVMIRSGVGMLLGALIAGWFFQFQMDGIVDDLANWRPFWAVPAVMAFGVLVYFWMGFNPRKGED